MPHPPLPPPPAAPDLFSHRDSFQLRDVWHALTRQRWLVALCCLAALGAVGAYTWWTVPVYQAATTVRIEPKQPSLPLPDVLQALSPDGDVETELEVLRSRSVATAVIDSLALQLELAVPRRVPRSALILAPRVTEAAVPGRYHVRRLDDGRFVLETARGRALARFAAGEPVDAAGLRFTLDARAAAYPELELRVRPYEETVRVVGRALHVSRPSRDAAILQARYRSSDPVLVREVPNVAAHAFIAQRADVQKTEVRSTVRFIAAQLDTLSLQLTSAEDALRSFREGAQAVDLRAEASASVDRLAALQAERGAVEAERAALGRLLAEVQAAAADAAPQQPSPYRRLVAFPSLLRNQAASEMLRSLAVAEDQRTQLLARRSLEDPDVRVLTQRIGELERQIHEIVATYQAGLTNHVRAADDALAQFGAQLARIPAKEVEFARLRRESAVLEEMYALLQTRLKEAQIAQAAEDPSVRVVDRAFTPDRPIRPRPLLNLSAALFFGLLFGSAAALTREHLDRTVRNRRDALVATGVPVLGLIPTLRPARHRLARLAPRLGRGAAASEAVRARGLLLDPGAPDREAMSEMYARIRTNLAFARPDEPVQVLLVTSALAGDGKSTTAANFALSVARAGHEVLLVDADLRRGVMHEVFGGSRAPGLTELLQQRAETGVFRRVDTDGCGRLDYLAAGTRAPNPTQLLGSQRMRALLDSLRERYELIVVDTAPVNLVGDTGALAAYADGVVLVARAGTSRMEAVAFAAEQLRNARAPLLGTIINDIDFERDAGYDDAYTWYGESGYHYLAAAAQDPRAPGA